MTETETTTKEEEITEKILTFKKKLAEHGLTGKDLNKLHSLKQFKVHYKKWKILLAVSIFMLIGFIAIFILELHIVLPVLCYHLAGGDVYRDRCLIESWRYRLFMLYAARPPVDCGFCQNITEVHKVKDISKEEFLERYAFANTPVVIKNATQGWPALERFNFDFFKSIYLDENIERRDCWFNPYLSEFRDLREVFSMGEEMAKLKDGAEPWYVGWAECGGVISNYLREHYETPYFLPDGADSGTRDWLFMGSPGYGAHMHLDEVDQMSWQAQITGTKQWTLEPPRECYFECVGQLKVVVNPGDIIVLNTNMWFHGTLILGEDLSITIGSEYF